MTRVLTRAPIYRSGLTRLLDELEVIERVDSGAAFAEKLAQWVDFRHAITLHGIHNAPPAELARPSLHSSVHSTLTAELQQRRLRLSASIQLPLPSVDWGLKASNAYEPLRRHHLARQQEMALQVRQLRAKVRGALRSASRRLQKLATLDAAFEHMLGERESKLFSSVPVLLEKRFRRLHKAHAQDTDPTWFPAFGNALQATLLAELEVRLHPSMGLIEAYNEEMKNHHE